jgi:hypothetical protein
MEAIQQALLVDAREESVLAIAEWEEQAVASTSRRFAVKQTAHLHEALDMADDESRAMLSGQRDE